MLAEEQARLPRPIPNSPYVAALGLGPPPERFKCPLTPSQLDPSRRPAATRSPDRLSYSGGCAAADASQRRRHGRSGRSHQFSEAGAGHQDRRPSTTMPSDRAQATTNHVALATPIPTSSTRSELNPARDRTLDWNVTAPCHRMPVRHHAYGFGPAVALRLQTATLQTGAPTHSHISSLSMIARGRGVGAPTFHGARTRRRRS